MTEPGRVYGQLLHVESLLRDAIQYRIAIFRVQGGLRGNWSCSACENDHNPDIARSNVDECVAVVKKAIDEHHAQRHEPRPG